nr:P1 family peptidase [Agrobacterium vitis]
MAEQDVTENSRARFRELGGPIGHYPAGPLNAITDVTGVSVGHMTLIDGERTRTGATAILPHGGNLFQDKVPAGFTVLNGYGKFAGSTQIVELGEIETPIVLTNTLAVGRAIEAINLYTLAQKGNERVTSLNAVAGETNDSRLNDIRAARPDVTDIGAAIAAAKPGPVEEGAVGAGTGTVAFGLKGGIGISSRLVEIGNARYTLGVLVQSNYGGHLIVAGKPYQSDAVHDKDGSIVMIVATDAPLCARNLTRLAERCFGGLARTGAALSNGSGDYALAFSTADSVRRTPARRKAMMSVEQLSNDVVSPLFEAVIEATEEAILNSLTMAVSMAGVNAATGKPTVVSSISLDTIRRL